jgi:hypothetical protein
MPSLSAKDRVSLCQFTFADGRRCRTPRTGKHPHFCFDHAQKEARALAEESLSKDLAYFFSGDYLSACDLSTAMGRLIPAVIRGDVKPRAARTVAYMAQILLQSIHIAQNEYIEAAGMEGWRKSILNSVNDNYNYRFPPAPATTGVGSPAPAPQQPASPQPEPASARPQPQPRASQPAQTPVNCHSERSEESASSSDSPLATHHSPLPQTPPPSPHTPLPPTSAEFAQHVLAGLPRSVRPGPTEEAGGAQTPQPAQATQQAPARAPQTPALSTTDNPQPTTAAQSTPQSAPTPPPNNPPRPSSGPSRDTPWWDFGRTIPPESHLL